ncbi:MAG: hypothetical protein VX405_02530 [Myxococcota bacterium]|nr:hypothetical protein [Myxococcales bacterium]MEC7750365.1 hypothetical protein [Myxococcota bacterium]
MSSRPVDGTTSIQRTQSSPAEVVKTPVEPERLSRTQDGFDSTDSQDILGSRHRTTNDLTALKERLLSQARETAKLFPESSHQGFQKALETSTERVMTALDAGRVTPLEAADALEMMREMMEATADLKAGRVDVLSSKEHGDGVRHWELESPDGDRFAVTTRRFRETTGDPRIGLRMLADDGDRLPGRHRMSMRLDLERWGQASVDVQFGTSSLDKRIHGLMKNEDGSEFLTETGKKLADHHFKKNLPDRMEEPDVFADLVQSFVAGRMSGFEIRQVER